MKTNSWAVVGAVAAIVLTVIGLVINAVMYGASSNALMLLIGFVSVQVPILMKLGSVETKVNGNYSAMHEQIQLLMSHYVDALKLIPPEIAKDIPPLPPELSSRGEDTENAH